MNVPMAYLRRDFLIWSSYRLAAFWQVAGVLVLIVVIYFAGNAISGQSDLIKEEDGSYVAFIMVGLAFMDILMQGLVALPRAISDNQRAGTLEPMLLAPIGELDLLVSFWLFRFLFALLRMSIFVVFGVAVLGFWHAANPLSVVAVLIPAEIAFMGMGALSAAFMILVKQGDPVLIAYTAATAVLGGALIPIDALPNWMGPFTMLIPLTHALSGIREGLAGGGLVDVAPQIAALSAMAVLMLPPGLLALRWSLQRSRKEGSLGEY